MGARYILRLDDACSTMDRVRWARMEALFDSQGIKPLVAVVPDNQDPLLRIDPPDPNFWSRVRDWQRKGWTIALHGYQHTFHQVDRKSLILPFYDRSEFAGLSLEQQSSKIRAAWSICKSQGVTPTAWIAPAHCFDQVTLQAIYLETSIRLISDGIAMNAYDEAGFKWLPQQLWSLTPRRYGLWTVCLHPNSQTQTEFKKLAAGLSSSFYQRRVTTVDQVIQSPRRRSTIDRLYSFYFWQRGHCLEAAINLRNRMRAKER